MISIKRDVYLFLFGLLFLLVTAYSIMVSQSYYLGLEESAKYEMLYEMRAVEKYYQETGTLPNTKGRTFQVFSSLDSMPIHFRKSFDWQAFEPGEIYEHYLVAKDNSNAHYLYASMQEAKANGNMLYFVTTYDESLYYQLLESDIPDSYTQFNQALLISGALLLAVFVMVRWLIFRLTQPVFRLAKWSSTLDTQEPPPQQKLRYQELIGLADTLTQSIERERESIAREETFLKTASHELRTPIATISASNELIERGKEHLSPSQKRATKRINRATANMNNLITALLWLSRKEQLPVQESDIRLRDLVNELIENNRYLIERKAVEVEIQCESAKVIELPFELTQITLTNLIRNAFQHCTEGQITIRVFKEGVLISNPTTEHDEESSPSGFGIGLTLVEKICHQQDWALHFERSNSTYVTELMFGKLR
ncbi:HAMP domain-containing histidine kinase [Vibrio sp. SCSIO 43140]|uniref:sensor histidine kinase n=1 Tax=Vibrio sp. SCSIO 43140 TaxID=2819100 RepID=UPI0020753F50|nr:HAMP domain-containing sensor histidine kinase [Vibrio sp. SCSIO 43140]USD63264.1 HAMP domain-containing histidine kinase [Vibrio sp. SCSIO 43140]